MEKRTGNGCLPLVFFDIVVALFLWGLLIALKAAGVVGMHWALVLSGIVWISWLLFAITALAVEAVRLFVRLKRWHRRRKVDRRIVRQAKAAGVWDKPQALGGRALSIYAWEHYGLVRKAGETDKELRGRCIQQGIRERDARGGARNE